MELGSIDTASTTLIALPPGRAMRRYNAKVIGLRPIGAFTQPGSLRDPHAFTSRRCTAVPIPTASTKFRS